MIDLKKAGAKETKFLKEAYENNKLAHSYLFVDNLNQRAVATAYWLACLVNCTGTDKPDGTCNNCMRILSGNFPDLFFVSSEEKASLSIDKIRMLKEELAKSPAESSMRIFIINDAEKLTLSAANALLNLLEEPVAPVITILITNNAENILPTIQSRTQIIDFKDHASTANSSMLEYDFSQEEIESLADTGAIDDLSNKLYQSMLKSDNMALVYVHELSNLAKSQTQQRYVFYYLNKLCLEKLAGNKDMVFAAKLLELLITANKMQASNVSFRNRLDYVALMEVGD